MTTRAYGIASIGVEDDERSLHARLIAELGLRPKRGRSGAAIGWDRRTGFQARLYRLVALFERDTALALREKEFRFIPDAYEFLVDDSGVIIAHCYEVEVGRPLAGTQLAEYCALWWILDDSERFDLRLTSIDRYGHRKEWDMAATALGRIAEAIRKHPIRCRMVTCES